jgi:hypothetical protein
MHVFEVILWVTHSSGYGGYSSETIRHGWLLSWSLHSSIKRQKVNRYV